MPKKVVIKNIFTFKLYTKKLRITLGEKNNEADAEQVIKLHWGN